MKTLTVLLIIAMHGCNKEKLNHAQKCVIQMHHYYNDTNMFLKSELVIHWHKVPAEELPRFEAYPKLIPYCDNNDTLETIVLNKCDLK